jgi:serine/threonine protein kinase
MKDPNIVRYMDITKADDEEGMLAILMEYIPGGSITFLLKFFKSFKEPLVKIYIGQVVKVLSRLHGKGIVHRDLKPDNLMVDDSGTVKLSDFGFIKSIYREFCPDFSQNLDAELRDK